jgi:PKD repeat protein
MNRSLYIYFFALLITGVFAGCTKEKAARLNAVYLFTVDGLQASFQNYSENGTGYSWDFGDNSPSTADKHPSHVYSKAGTYPVKLTVKGANGQTDSFEDKVTIYGPSIRVDGNFTDWRDIPYLDDNIVHADGIIKKMKVWGDRDKMSVYIEGNSTLTSAKIIELFVNADNNHQTGWAAGWYSNTGSGIELVLSGDYVGQASDPWAARYAGDGGWTQPVEIPGYSGQSKFSDIKPVDNGMAFEFSISKLLLEKSLRQPPLKSAVTFNIFLYDAGWGTIGSAPKIWSPQLGQIPITFQ